MSEKLPADLYDAASTRAIDAAAISTLAISGLDLMERAGEAAFATLCTRWPDVRRVGVVCGTGNNGGDGFVVARLGAAAGLEVDVRVVGDASTITGDAARCYERLRAAAIPSAGFSAAFSDVDVVVDALFGTGLDREVGGDQRRAVALINESAAPCLSLDMPSGINADTGRLLGLAVRAAATVTFIALKQGLLTGDGPAFAGDIVFRGLDVPAAVKTGIACTAQRLDYTACVRHFSPRMRTAHKGDFGHVLAVGGAPGFSGAIRLAGEAAARVGAGLVSVATHPGHAAGVNATRPELMCHAATAPADLRTLLSASVIALGPGLGQGDWSRAMFAGTRDARCPLVFDADALNLLAQDPDRRDDRIITPHPGEAARLLGATVAEVQADRFAAARAMQERYGGVVVLKGAGTVVYEPSTVPLVISAGNPGMASGGMGDVLTGIVAGLVAQGLPLLDAAAVGACIHAWSADQAARDGERGLLASDLMPFIRQAVNPGA